LYDIVAERALLASVMISGNAAATAMDEITGEEFYDPQNGTLFRCLKKLYSDGLPLDVNIIHSHLTKAKANITIEFLLELMDEVASGANVIHYIEIVRDHYTRRKLQSVAEETLRRLVDPAEATQSIVADTERSVYDIALDPAKVIVRPLGGLVRDAVGKVSKLYENPVYVTGLPTGFVGLDKITGGLHPGEFIIVAGRPSMGKTTFALNMARHICVENLVPGVFFSLEMTADQLGLNLLCCHCGVDSAAARTGHLSSAAYNSLLNEGGPSLYDSPLYVDDSPELTITSIRARARRYIRQYKAKVIFLDYIQFVRGAARIDSREQQVADISRGLKGLAKDLGVPVVALSQLNRNSEARSDKRPLLSDLRESGSIEQDADMVMLLHRPDYYDSFDRPNEIDITVAKNRNGPTGKVTLAYLRHKMRMSNLQKESSDDSPPRQLFS